MRHLTKKEIELIILQEMVNAPGWLSWFLTIAAFSHLEYIATEAARKIVEREDR